MRQLCLLFLFAASCSCSTATQSGNEACGNGADDDGDSKTDCADPDCFSMATCCVDLCEEGVALCDDMGVRTCEKNPVSGCRELSSPAACMNGQVCSGGSCAASCTNRCALGEKQCVGPGATAECQTLATGCRDWVVARICPTDSLCGAGTSGAIASCSALCTEGARRCTATGEEQLCVSRGNGCTDWAFPSGSCSSGAGGGGGGSGGGTAGGGSAGGTAGGSAGGAAGGAGGGSGTGGGFAIPAGTWALSAGGLAADEGLGVTVTTEGRVVVVGTYSSAAATFGRLTPNKRTLTSAANGYGQLFVAQYELDGGFVDARGYPDSQFGSKTSGVTALPGGDYAVLAMFGRSLTLAPGVTVDAGVGQDLALVRFRPDAGVAWVRTSGSTNYSIDVIGAPVAHGGGVSWCADGSGAMQIGYGLPNEFSFDGGFGRTPYAARFSGTGDLVFARNTMTAGSGGAYGCAGTPNGGVFLGGLYSNTLRFFTSTGGLYPIATGALGYAGFISRLDPAGHVLWAQTIDTVGSATVWHLAAAPDDGVVAAGYYKSQTTVGSRTLPIPPGGDEDNYLARFEGDGGTAWVVRTMGTRPDFIRSISVGAQGDIAIGGWSDSVSLTFESTSGDGGMFAQGSSAPVGFVAAYSQTGQFRWVRRIAGPETTDVRSVVMLEDGTVVATGTFAGTAAFQLTPTRTVMMTSTSGTGPTTEIFVARFGP